MLNTISSQNNNKLVLGQKELRNPAVSYLMALGSAQSRVTMSSFLNTIARLSGYENLSFCEWEKIRRDDVIAILEILKQQQKSPATINTYLAAIKGVAEVMWSNKQITTDDYLLLKKN